MAFFTSSNPNQTNFSVVGSTSSSSANRLRSFPVPVYHRQELGTESTLINPLTLVAPCISITPDSRSVTYTLPTAAQILQLFGRNLESGLSHVYPGTVMELQIVNRGTGSADIASNATGGDGSVVTCSTGGGNYEGRGTKIFLEFTSVSSGVGGCTGEYTIYP